MSTSPTPTPAFPPGRTPGRRRSLRRSLVAGLLGLGLLAAVPQAAHAAPTPTPSDTAQKSSKAKTSQKAERTTVPTLAGRAVLSADYNAGGPPSGKDAGTANGRTGPFPGQVIPGFSAMVDNGDGTFWAMPDNGFGTQANSSDFLLRLYLVRPHFETAAGGSGKVDVLRHISLNDRDRVLDFPITNPTGKRLLTGADFDIESLVHDTDGTWWIGEEFGPFLLHFDAKGTLIDEPVKTPGAMSPQNPYLDGRTPTARASRGFEAMAVSPDGRYLYPILEGALVKDTDQRRRWILQYDVRAEKWTGKRWAYQTTQAANVIGDAFMTARNEMIIIERDDFGGPQAVTKRLYKINLKKQTNGYVKTELIADLLKIANPDHIGMNVADPGRGVADPFSFPMVSVETVVQLKDGRLLVANDNNYPFNDARHAGSPDDTEMIILDLVRKRGVANQKVIISHRGASGYRPEHTLASYELAIRQCADYIEPDVVPTKDGKLIARHENEIGGTTNVADHPEFADRRTTKTIDGSKVTGWFTEDFTLAEIKTLRAKERLPQLRGTAFDGLYEIPTLDEVLTLATRSKTCAGKPVGVYPETKHPTYFDSIDLSLEEPLLDALRARGLNKKNAPVFIQSFEVSNLRELNQETPVKLVQLIDCTSSPYDQVKAGTGVTNKTMVTRQGIAQIAKYADGLGLCKDLMIPRDSSGKLLQPTTAISDAHKFGLVVHGWTFRAENNFLPADFRIGTDPAAHGDLNGEIDRFVAAGMDGLFSDFPDLAVQAVNDGA